MEPRSSQRRPTDTEKCKVKLDLRQVSQIIFETLNYFNINRPIFSLHFSRHITGSSCVASGSIGFIYFAAAVLVAMFFLKKQCFFKKNIAEAFCL